MIEELKKDLKRLGNPEKAVFLKRFFKTGAGEYAEGDVLIGVSVPDIRKSVRSYREMPLREVEKLLTSSIHEHRLAALLILVDQFERGSKVERDKILKVYLKNTKYVNNWDLVDSSAPYILGACLVDTKDRKVLDRLAASKSLWEQRIAMIATYALIKQNDFADALRIAEVLLPHDHDLIHKAVGWMLREVGNRDLAVEEKFLKKHYKTMARTSLRYAIEKFPESKRQTYLKGKV